MLMYIVVNSTTCRTWPARIHSSSINITMKINWQILGKVMPRSCKNLPKSWEILVRLCKGLIRAWMNEWMNEWMFISYYIKVIIFRWWKWWWCFPRSCKNLPRSCKILKDLCRIFLYSWSYRILASSCMFLASFLGENVQSLGKNPGKIFIIIWY